MLEDFIDGFLGELGILPHKIRGARVEQGEQADSDTLEEIGVIEDMDVFDLPVGENEACKKEVID